MAKKQPKIAVEWYDAKAAARIGGLTVDMINYLCRQGIIAPSGGGARGRGTARKYTYADVLLLRVIAKLLEQGISVLRLKRSLAALQKNGGSLQDLVTKRLVATDGYNVYFGRDNVLEMLGSGQMAFAFIIELNALRKEVSATIATFKVA
jgi:DNA-binding transcriptional MerR regulator